MPVYNVRLESGTDDHARHVTINAETEDEARTIAENLEAGYVAYNLDNDPDADADTIRATVQLSDDGKTRGGTPRDRVRLHMHHQQQPYQIVSVEEAAKEK